MDSFRVLNRVSIHEAGSGVITVTRDRTNPTLGTVAPNGASCIEGLTFIKTGKNTGQSPLSTYPTHNNNSHTSIFAETVIETAPRIARGFRNFENYRIRNLLAAATRIGGNRPVSENILCFEVLVGDGAQPGWVDHAQRVVAYVGVRITVPPGAHDVWERVGAEESTTRRVMGAGS
nr:transposase [Arthrobacter alpinus]